MTHSEPKPRWCCRLCDSEIDDVEDEPLMLFRGESYHPICSARVVLDHLEAKTLGEDDGQDALDAINMIWILIRRRTVS